MDRATEKDWPKRPTDRQLLEARNKTVRAMTPMVEAVHVPTHLVLPGSPQAKQLHHLHSQPSLGQSATGKKVLRLCAQGHFGHVALFATLWTVACQVSLSGMGVLQVRTLECIDQYLLPYPSRALYFLLP